MTRRPCLAEDCHRTTSGTYCDEHDVRRRDRHHASPSQRGYDAEYLRNRPLVLARDGWTCAYCGGPATTVDHVVPWRISHDNGMGNLVAACLTCNSSKGGRA